MKLKAEKDQKARAAMKVTMADESRRAEEALHASKHRLGKIDGMKFARVLRLGTVMKKDLWKKVDKILKMKGAKISG